MKRAWVPQISPQISVLGTSIRPDTELGKYQ